MPAKKSTNKSKAASETVRDKAKKAQVSAAKPKRRLKTSSVRVLNPIKKGASFARKEVHLPISNNKSGFLHKKRRIIPKYFRESWEQLKLVTWPDRRETIKLTIAVFIFAIVIAVFVAAVDWVFTKIFREVLLG